MMPSRMARCWLLSFWQSSVIIHTMDASQSREPISALLRQTIVESGVSYNALQKATGVTRASIMRFVRGSQSLRLDRADQLAEFFGLELRKRGEGRWAAPSRRP
jgi:hypothetical protein